MAQKKFSGRCAVCKSPDRFRIELLKAGGVGLDALILVAQLAAANETGDSRTSAYVADKLRMLLETLAKVTGQLGSLASSITFNTTNVAVLAEHPHFLKIQATMLQALAPHPDARADVVRALRSLDEENARAPAAAKIIEHLPPTEGPNVAA